MSASDFLTAALKLLPPKPADTAKRKEKKAYSEVLSARLALCFSAELRRRGLAGTRPTEPGDVDLSGAERRMAGGIGAKKVDVTWATEESGLQLGISIKTINFRDRKTKNFQKNLTNRRGDMLVEAVTLHRRFPYAVLAGFFFFDEGAATDGTTRRKSTFLNAHHRFKIFTGRADPAGRDEQYERLYVVLHNANPFDPSARVFLAGFPDKEVPLEQAFDELITLAADRNPDFYEVVDGRLRKLQEASSSASKSKLVTKGGKLEVVIEDGADDDSEDEDDE